MSPPGSGQSQGGFNHFGLLINDEGEEAEANVTLFPVWRVMNGQAGGGVAS